MIRPAWRKIGPPALAGLIVVLGSGCATPLERARANFELGRLDQAEAALNSRRVREADRVLFLMERGAIRQARGDYAGSTADFLAAAELIEAWETYSISRGAASLAVNDAVQRYRGAPYERTLLHTMTALNHLALGHWENAAVEARRIIRTLEPDTRGDYPDCAFARYVAGVCLELAGDHTNAALQYRLASELNPATVPPPSATRASREALIFVMLGRMPSGVLPERSWSTTAPRLLVEPPGGTPVETAPMTDALELAFTTEQRELARKVAKTVTRVVIKDQLAEAVRRSTKDDVLAELTRFVLIGLLEQPDVRRWETLPRYFYAARIPYSNPGAPIRMSITGGSAVNVESLTPAAAQGPVHVILYREIPPRAYF